MQNKDYRSTFAVSQSAIKDFRFKSPRRWKDIWIDKQQDLDKNEESFIFGSLVDTLLFTPELMEKRFHVADVSKIPTGNIEKIVHGIYDNLVSFTLTDLEGLPSNFEASPLKDVSKDEIIRWCDKYEWNNHWKEDTRVNKIIEKGSEYFDLLSSAVGRKVITTETNMDAIGIVNILRKTENVKCYFTDCKDYRNIFQLEIFETFVTEDDNNVPVKCAIDILHIDEKNKTLQICDFKTSYSAHNFTQSIKQFGYCDQLSFYTSVLRKSLKNEIFMQNIGLNSSIDWKILEPINIVIDENEKLPYIYEYDWKDIDLARDGNSTYLYSLYQTNDHNGRIKKGWNELLGEIAWHIRNDKWDYPVEIYKTGRIKVNLANL